VLTEVKFALIMAAAFDCKDMYDRTISRIAPVAMPATTALKVYRGGIAIGHKLLERLFGSVGSMRMGRSL
jgi:hypothetical protein